MAEPFYAGESKDQALLFDLYRGWGGDLCHPNAPMGGGGPGFFTQAGPLNGIPGFGKLPHPDSPWGTQLSRADIEKLAGVQTNAPSPAPAPPTPTPIPGAKLSTAWKKTVDDGLTNKSWDEYDELLKAEAAAYDKKFAKAPAFDWLDFKAMLWVESGGPSNRAWKQRALQIGNPGDPGYTALKSGQEGTDLILSKQLAEDIKSKIDDPKVNIQAGIAYLLARMAVTETVSVDDPTDTAPHEYVVVAGDSFYAIAKKVHSTVDALKAATPGVTVLHPGQKIRYRKAVMTKRVKNWRTFDNATIATRYNGGGDPDYDEKLAYVKYLFKHLKR